MSTWQPDILGPDYEQLTLDLPHSSPATLIRYVGHAARNATAALDGADVLYVHGWSDYFFQKELAEFWHRAGANFYAVDLHGYGRSMTPGTTPGAISDLKEYDADIAAALSFMGRDVVGEGSDGPVSGAAATREPSTSSDETAEGTSSKVMAWISDAVAALTQLRSKAVVQGERPLILLGHSTGGLILSLWAARHQGVANSLILNSPWLEFQANEVGRAVMAPIIQARNRFRPFAPLPGFDPGFYARAVSSRFDGEWDYNSAWRPDRGFAVNTSFMNAVFAGQATVSRGLHLDVPVLVMLSDKSYLQPRWSGTALAADVVLNVDSVARRALDLGPDVTLHRISGAFHDIFLSHPEIRADAYSRMGRWADSTLDPVIRHRWESGSSA